LEETSVAPQEEEEPAITPEPLEETLEAEESVIPGEPPALVEESEPITALEPEKPKFGGLFDRFLKFVKGKILSPAPVVPEELEETPVSEDLVIPSEPRISVEELALPEPAVTSPAVTSEEEAPSVEAVVVPEELEEIPVPEEPVIPSEPPISVEELALPEPAITSEEEAPSVEAVPEETDEMTVLEELVIPSEPPISVEELTPPEPAVTSDGETS
ncbi:MAG: hypothetical protein F6K14_34120, partial [Symploca sp. SIO2C1]|nr:hypothetical protein [Symploca sp. SIO2C1]